MLVGEYSDVFPAPALRSKLTKLTLGLQRSVGVFHTVIKGLLGRGGPKTQLQLYFTTETKTKARYKIILCKQASGYKTKTEDLRPKNEDPVKIVLKSLKKGSKMILDRNRNKEHHDLQLSTNLTTVFVLYITLPKVQNEDLVKIVLKSLKIT